MKAALKLLAAATIRGTRTRMRIISDDGHRASVRPVRDVRLVSRLTVGMRGFAYY